MCQHRCSISILLVSVALATLGLQHTGWLDRLVLYNKQKLFQELGAMVPLSNNLTPRPSPPAITAAIQPKPEGYEDSRHWDYDSVIRLLTLIRESEAAKPVHMALRRMLRPTRRIMMSMKESKHRFPSIKKDDNEFYYDVRYSSSEENTLPAPPPVPEDQVLVSVSNPVEARLPSARISVKLLREILEARARAARQMPSTVKTIPPWLEFIKHRTTTAAPKSNPKPTEESNPEPTEESNPEPSEESNPEPSKETNPESSEKSKPKPSEESNTKPNDKSNSKPSEESNPKSSEKSKPEPSEESNPKSSGGNSTENNATTENSTVPNESVSGGGNITGTVSGGDNTTATVSGGDNTTATVSGGDNTTATVSGGDNTTATVSGGDNTTAIVSGGDNTTTTVSGGGNITGTVSGGDNTTGSVSGGD